MRFDIRYRTLFTYDNLVRESQNELRTCPATDEHQQLISYRVATAPSSRVFSFPDYWGTRVDAFGVRTPHLSLEVTAEASVETRSRPLVPASADKRFTLDDDAKRPPRYFVSAATTQTVTRLSNGTTDRFRVRAWTSVGVSGFSTITNPVIPQDA
jgi:hypothetical protein